jgi:hypothetical protein
MLPTSYIGFGFGERVKRGENRHIPFFQCGHQVFSYLNMPYSFEVGVKNITAGYQRIRVVRSIVIPKDSNRHTNCARPGGKYLTLTIGKSRCSDAQNLTSIELALGARDIIF